MSRRTVAVWSGAAAATVAVLATIAVVFVAPLADRPEGPSRSTSPTPTFTPAPAVLSAVTATPPAPGAPALGEVLEPLFSAKALGGHVGVAVVELGSGEQVYGLRAESGFIPASTAKLLTVTAALESLGPAHRFTTRVVQGAAPDEIVLVGGGDPLLTAAPADPKVPDAQVVPRPSRIADLAAATATQLRARGVTSVRLGFDDTLFTGPATSPDWPRAYVAAGVVGPVSALSLDGGRARPDGDARVKDPAASAAETFAAHLVAAGIDVMGVPTRVAAQPTAPDVASLESATVETIVEWVLAVSDNDGAEALGRHVAIANNQPATFDGATASIVQVVSRIGVDLSNAVLRDASGLSRGTRISPNDLAATLAVAARPSNGRLRAVITGLPVAGFTGSLSERFERQAASDGQGIVRAKTGTLTGVSALAGVVPTADGGTFAFAVLADRVANGTDNARRALDRVVAALADCGCGVPWPTPSASSPPTGSEEPEPGTPNPGASSDAP